MASSGDVPLVPPPDGQHVNLAHPPRNGDTAGFWVPGVGIVLCTLSLGIRLYTNGYVTKTAGLDDVCLVVAWAFSLAIQFIIIYMRAHNVLAVHIWDLTINDLNYSLNMTTVASILYCPMLAFAKVSILILYHRLGPIRWFRITIYVSMFIVIAANFSIIFPFIFSCSPFKRGWDVTITEGHCVNHAALYIATAVINMATDLILLVLPIPLARKLQMPTIQKVGLVILFGVGSATFVTSCIRLVVLLPLLDSADATWAVSTPSIWITVEANLVIICVTLPAFRRFLRHIAPHLIGERGSRSREPNTADSTPLHTIGGGEKGNRGVTPSQPRKDEYGQYGHYELDHDESEGTVSLRDSEMAIISHRSDEDWPLEAGPAPPSKTLRRDKSNSYVSTSMKERRHEWPNRPWAKNV